MKWGVRRYQNKDGSLTPKGKKRLEKINKRYDKVFSRHKGAIEEESMNKEMYEKDISDLKKNRTKAKAFRDSWIREDYDESYWEQAVDRLIDDYEDGRDISARQIETSKKVIKSMKDRRISELQKYGLEKYK